MDSSLTTIRLTSIKIRESRPKLASVNYHLTHVGLPTVRVESGRTSSHQCFAPHRRGFAPLFGVARNDWSTLAQRLRCRGFCNSSVARRIRCLDRRAQRRAERAVRYADFGRIRSFCPAAVRQTLPSYHCRLCLRLDVQTDAGDSAVPFAPARLLAAQPI